MTRLGEKTFKIPQVRGGGFYRCAMEKESRAYSPGNKALKFRRHI
jgi:hypothetical protein